MRERDLSKDLGTSSDRAMYSPSEARGRGSAAERNQGGEQDRDEQPPRGHDAGRTQGGGSGGHSPSRDVQDQANIRNNSRVLDESGDE